MDALHKSRLVQRVPPRNGYSRQWGFRRNIFARNPSGRLITRDRDAPQAGALV